MREEAKSLRARLEMHRATPTCATCHRVMDPLGLALENFDGIGRWRVKEPGGQIDPAGQLADGSRVDGPVALRKAVLKRPELFVRTVTQKLMTYGLGRGMEYTDMPVIRGIATASAAQNYRENPCSSCTSKVVISDTDHLWGHTGGDNIWVWKSFTRGLNVLFMEEMLPSPTWQDSARQAMGQVRRFAERMNLAAMKPEEKLSATRYCLAARGKEYLVFQHDKGEAALNFNLFKVNF